VTIEQVAPSPADAGAIAAMGGVEVGAGLFEIAGTSLEDPAIKFDSLPPILFR
jgi:hypothetical protein